MNPFKIRFFAIYLCVLWLITILITINGCDEDSVSAENPADMPYEVEVDSADFVNNPSGNTYFPLSSGRTMVYEGESEDGTQVRVEVEFIGQNKVILGVMCAVVNDRVYEDEELVEDTFDWYAQDLEGNIWYFGEDTKELEDGEVVSTEGSWESGVDGALPGIIMFNDPLPGVWYRQEFLEGEAEDVAQILSTDTTITVPFGSFQNCLQIAEWTPLERGVVEHKFYAPDVGVIRVETVEGGSDFEELTEILQQ